MNTKSKLLKSIENTDNRSAYTENMALTNRSTLSATVDFFGLGGALRTRDEADIWKLFEKAFNEDALVALKTLFYFRDIRGGQGERRTFRTIIGKLAKKHPDVVLRNLCLIPFFGRWDDLFSLENTPLWPNVVALIKNQLDEDATNWRQNKPISLLAKWMVSINTSSKESVRLAKKLATDLEVSYKQYRKTCSNLRKHLNVIEQKMCAGQWGDINYEQVPSKASMTYRKAFGRHDQERYADYLGAVEKGEKEIKAAALYPYEIVEKVGFGGATEDRTLEAQWKALPNYLGDEPYNGLVVADVSGSMQGRPITISISLAMYFAERNKGKFNGYFITFSERPALQKVVGNTLAERINNLARAQWDMNTNLQRVFDLILGSALRDNVPESEMVKTIFIISDMEFDSACTGMTNFEAIKAKYAIAGYEMPKLVFWNVNARRSQTPMTVDDNGTCLVSGCSPSILKSILARKIISPADIMIETINSERYNCITV